MAAKRKRPDTPGPNKSLDRLVRIIGETKEPRFGPTERMREDAMTETVGSTWPAIVTKKNGNMTLRLPPPTKAAASNGTIPSKQ